MVGRDPEVDPAALDQLEHGLQHPDDRAVRAVLPFGKPAQTVEVTEELVSAVDEVNDHSGLMLDRAAARSKVLHAAPCEGDQFVAAYRFSRRRVKSVSSGRQLMRTGKLLKPIPRLT